MQDCTADDVNSHAFSKEVCMTTPVFRSDCLAVLARRLAAASEWRWGCFSLPPPHTPCQPLHTQCSPAHLWYKLPCPCREKSHNTFMQNHSSSET